MTSWAVYKWWNVKAVVADDRLFFIRVGFSVSLKLYILALQCMWVFANISLLTMLRCVTTQRLLHILPCTCTASAPRAPASGNAGAGANGSNREGSGPPWSSTTVLPASENSGGEKSSTSKGRSEAVCVSVCLFVFQFCLCHHRAVRKTLLS